MTTMGGYDALVLGAGIAGLAAARALAEAGQRVAVIEAGTDITLAQYLDRAGIGARVAADYRGV